MSDDLPGFLAQTPEQRRAGRAVPSLLYQLYLEARAAVGEDAEPEEIRRYVAAQLERRRERERERGREREEKQERWRTVEAKQDQAPALAITLRRVAATTAPEAPCLTVNQAARRLGLTPGTFRQRVDRGTVRSVKVGVKRLVPVSEVERLEREQERAA